MKICTREEKKNYGDASFAGRGPLNPFNVESRNLFQSIYNVILQI